MIEFTIFKINSGAIKADDHYTETGHQIELQCKENALRNDTYFDKIKYYKCLECSFSSQGGERVKRLD